MSQSTFKLITTLALGSAVAALAAVDPATAADNSSKGATTASKNLIAQNAPMVPNPNITIDGVPAPANSSAPTAPRAIAPPVGDISVSNLDAAIPQISLDSNVKVNMVLKATPAREVLESLARSANLNLAYSEGIGDPAKAATATNKEATITLNLRNEPVQNAFNYVLQLSGLEANRVGNTIFVGPKLPDSVRETVVRTLRMNQISAAEASAFLASQGAESRIPQERETTESVEIGKVIKTSTKKTIEVGITRIDAADGPVLLRGLAVNVDGRLNTITLVGSPRKVEMASAMLTRLDARRRQVALNVKIVDVNLNNTDSISNSMSFKVGDGFLAVDNGAAVYNYGGYNPASKAQVLNSVTTPPVAALNLPGGNQPFLDYSPNANLSNQQTFFVDPIVGGPQLGSIPRPGLGSEANPYQPGVTAYTPARSATVPATFNTGTTPVVSPVTGQTVQPGGLLSPATTTVTPAVYTYALPTNVQIPTKFLSTLQAQIISGNGKILTDPTLVVQEGQKSSVDLTQEVFGGFELSTASTGSNASTTVRKPIIKNAGLELELIVDRIDDNGFISVSVTPKVSAIGGSIATADGEVTLIQSRTMKSGSIRLRDGQTLILSGIIQETDRTTVSKTPILGDIPILGALFRSTNKTNQRQEVVVLLTPQILDDQKSAVNYTPGTDARLMLGNGNR